ncbi:MAG: hypothetical protein ABI548_17360 [Polyangiaceae bacterium]
MKHLVPCPECGRHVRVSETACPFCALPLDLAGTPEHRLPTSRLSRAATLAFGATLVSATALAGCGGDAETGTGSAAGAPGMSTAGAAGTSTAGASTGGGIAIYGAPAGGEFGNENGGGGAIPVYGAPAGGGGAVPFYGAPAGGDTGNENGGSGQVPVYGAAGDDGAAGNDSDAAGKGGGGAMPVYGGPPR